MTRIDWLTVREVDNRDPRDMARWQEARADALRERLVRLTEERQERQGEPRRRAT